MSVLACGCSLRLGPCPVHARAWWRDEDERRDFQRENPPGELTLATSRGPLTLRPDPSLPPGAFVVGRELEAADRVIAQQLSTIQALRTRVAELEKERDDAREGLVVVEAIAKQLEARLIAELESERAEQAPMLERERRLVRACERSEPSAAARAPGVHRVQRGPRIFVQGEED